MRKKLTIFTFSILIVAVFCSIIGCSNQNNTTIDDTNIFDTEVEDMNEIVAYSIAMNSAGQPSVSNEYVAQILNAVVTPATLVNPLVNWSISWSDSSVTEKIDEYIRVVPSYEGSRQAEVRCYKALPCDAIVTVTILSNGASDSCVVKFVGIPSSFSITPGTSRDSNGNIENILVNSNGNYYVNVDGWHSHSFNLVLSNIFDSVGSEYNNYTAEVISATGNINVCDAYENNYGEKTYYTDTLTQKPLELYFDDFAYFDIRFDGPTMYVKFNIADFHLGSSSGSDDDTYYYDMFHSFVAFETYVIQIKVTNSTGLSEVIKIELNAGNSAIVNLSKSEIVF